jgi:hypothetical protein
MGGNEDAGPTLAHPQDITKMSDSLALGGGPSHFFVRSSFSAACSSIDSAESFFSLQVLLFQRPQTLGVPHLHAAVFGLPVR